MAPERGKPDASREVFAYVQEKKPVMPRTALQYAIELMPAEIRAETMIKDWK